MDRQRMEQEAELMRLSRVKHLEPARTPTLGDDIISLYKKISREFKKYGKIGTAWEELVPRMLLDHCAIESYSRGKLTILVDNSAQLYDLKQLLLSGLERQLILACRKEGLKNVALKMGRIWE
jgi:hypothetical protein